MPKREYNDDFDQWIDDLDQDSHRSVWNRACADLGWDRELRDDGFLVDGDIFSQEFMAAVHSHYQAMYINDLFERLSIQGRIKPDGVREDGTIIYVQA